MEKYPDVSQALGEKGTTVLRYTIAADGTTKQITLQQPSGAFRLDIAAARSVSAWRYTPPATKDGVPASCETQLSIPWVPAAGPVPAGRVAVPPLSAFPPESLRRQEEGVTMLTVTTRPDGSIVRATVIRSSGHPDLDMAAVAYLQTSVTIVDTPDRKKPRKSEPFSVVWALPETTPVPAPPAPQ